RKANNFPGNDAGGLSVILSLLNTIPTSVVFENTICISGLCAASKIVSQSFEADSTREIALLMLYLTTSCPSSIPFMHKVYNPCCSANSSVPDDEVDLTTKTRPLNTPALFALSTK